MQASGVQNTRQAREEGKEAEIEPGGRRGEGEPKRGRVEVLQEAPAEGGVWRPEKGRRRGRVVVVCRLGRSRG